MRENGESLQSTVQFLMYSYFGDWKDDPLYATISRAYRDATMRRAFVFPKEKNKDDKETLERYGTEIIREEMIKYINDDFNSKSHIKGNEKAAYDRKIKELQDRVDHTEFNNGDNYTKWHEKLCTELFTLYGIYSEKEKVIVPFSFGNAQKWVNMAVKYLYLMSLLYLKSRETKTWCKKIIKNSQFFHIPLDSYILKALFYITTRKESICKRINKKYRDIEKTDLIKNENLNYADSNGKFVFENTNKSVAWSNIDSYKDYLHIQGKVQEQIPIDKKFQTDHLAWENKVWIYAAQIIN